MCKSSQPGLVFEAPDCEMEPTTDTFGGLLLQDLLGNQYLQGAMQTTASSSGTDEEASATDGSSLTQTKWDPGESIDRLSQDLDLSQLSADELAYFDQYGLSAQEYLSRDNWAGTPLTGEMYKSAAIRAYLAYGRDLSMVVPLDLALAQGQFESHFGLTGRESHATNPYNIGEYDSGSASWVDEITTPEMGVAMYYDLMAQDYLSASSVEELVAEGGFVNEDGSRYASNLNYESDLRGQMAFIRDLIGMPDPGSIGPTEVESKAPSETTDPPTEVAGSCDIADVVPEALVGATLGGALAGPLGALAGGVIGGALGWSNCESD